MRHILHCHEMVKPDIVRGESCYLYDKDGKRYVDFEAGTWCTVVGHNNPRINKKIIEQINKVMHLGYRFTNYVANEAAASLLETVDEKDGKCVFLCSGTEAVEFSITVAKLITGRNLLLALSESYLGAYGSAGMKYGNWIEVNLYKCLKCQETQCLRDCENLKNINMDDIAAFVFESGSRSGKVIFPPQKLIHLVVKEVKSSNGLIVANEVTTGFGRTGKWYGYNHYGIRPDIIAIGKGLGNGYPVSAVVMKNEIGKEVEKSTFRYVQSHQNDPLGCTIANEVIKIMKEDDLVNRSHELGSKFIGYLEEIKHRFPFVKEVRGKGLMIAVEFSKSNDNFNVELIFNEMLKRGFIIGFKPDATLIRFLPPLIIEEKEIETVLENLNVLFERVN